MIEDLVHVFPVSKKVLQLRLMRELLGVDYSIVHVARENPSIYPRSKFRINHCLERCRGVCQTEEHDRWFKETFGCEESSFPFVTFLNSDVVVSPSDVELREQGAACQSIDNLRYQG